jgi:hypothetical protein
VDFFGPPLVIEPSPGQLSSDAGLLPIRQFDERIGLTQAFAAALDDPRDPDLTEHTFLEMVRSRIYGILAGYEDQNDHDTLRHDPVFKLVADHSPDDDDLASQPTLSRFENAISIQSLKRLRDVLLDQFIASFDTPPRHLTFDLDAIDDPAHGHQQLTFWHGYYDQNQYLPLVITCADNDQFVLLSLRPGNVHAALGADDDLAYLVTRLRQVWPDVVLHFRGDCAFGVPTMYDVCERLRVGYTFGLSANAVLQRQTEGLLTKAVDTYEQERQAARQQNPPRPALPSRLFTGFWYQAGTWPQARWVVAKAEANDRGTNRRFVVTNRPGSELLPGPTYDEYAARGECDLIVTPAALKRRTAFLLNATLEDEHVSLTCDGLQRVPGFSKLGDFHYVPVLFSEGRKIRKQQRVLLDVCGLFLSRLQGRAPGNGIIWHGKAQKSPSVASPPSNATTCDRGPLPRWARFRWRLLPLPRAR